MNNFVIKKVKAEDIMLLDGKTYVEIDYNHDIIDGSRLKYGSPKRGDIIFGGGVGWTTCKVDYTHHDPKKPLMLKPLVEQKTDLEIWQEKTISLINNYPNFPDLLRNILTELIQEAVKEK